MKFGRKCAVMTLLFGMLPILGGCWDRTEVNDLALIMGTGVDLTKNGKVELSVQIFSPNQSISSDQSGGMMGGGSGGDTTVVQSASGADFAEAAEKLQEQMPRKVFWGHGEVFIFGEEFAKKGILNEIDFLFRHPQPRERAHVYVSKGEAKGILSIHAKVERDIAETLREMSVMPYGMDISLKELNEMLSGRSKAAVVPLVQRKEESRGNAVPYISGVAVLKGGKLQGEFNDKAKNDTLLIRNKLKRTILTFPVESKQGKEIGKMTVKIIKCRTRLIPVINGDRWSVIVHIEGEASVLQNESHVNVMKPQEVRRLEEQMNLAIGNHIQETFRLIQRETGADVFGVADAFWRKYPNQWIKSQRQWDEIFQNVEIHTDPKVKILWPGFSGKSFK